MIRVALLKVAWLLIIPATVFGQQAYGRQQTWIDTLWFDHSLNGQDVDTTDAVYIGHTDPTTLTLWTKADENVGNVDVRIRYQFKLKEVGRFDHDWDELGYVVKDHLKDAGWTFWRFMEPTKTKADEAEVDSLVGENFLIEIGEGRNLEFLCLNFTLVTRDSVGDRYVTVVINDPATSTFSRFQCGSAQSANDTVHYSFFPGSPDIGPSTIGTGICQAPMPPNLVLKNGARIRSVVYGLKGNDKIMDITLGGRKNVQPEFAFKMPGAADSLRFIVNGNLANGASIDLYLSVSGKK